MRDIPHRRRTPDAVLHTALRIEAHLEAQEHEIEKIAAQLSNAKPSG